MPRQAKGPRLWFRQQRGRKPVWLIKDGTRQYSTGCGAAERETAERRLAEYLAQKHEPPTREATLERIRCADVLNLYVVEHAPTTQSDKWIGHTAGPCVEFWHDKTLADVRGQTCREYVEWRCAQGVSDQTARHDLKTFRAAINYYHREYGPLNAVPVVTLPKKGPSRVRWLTRSEMASLVWQAYIGGYEHVLRVLLIGYYTGTRPGAIYKLRWLPSTDAGYFDLNNGMLYRRGDDEMDSVRKLRPPVPIPTRLLPHLRRWHAKDLKDSITHVIHWNGQPIQKLRRSWPAVRTLAGIDGRVTPHTLRHTCVTWLLQAGIDIWEVAGFVGMSEETVRDVYGHHHPAHLKNAARAKRKQNE